MASTVHLLDPYNYWLSELLSLFSLSRTNSPPPLAVVAHVVRPHIPATPASVLRRVRARWRVPRGFSASRWRVSVLVTVRRSVLVCRRLPPRSRRVALLAHAVGVLEPRAFTLHAVATLVSIVSATIAMSIAIRARAA